MKVFTRGRSRVADCYQRGSALLMSLVFLLLLTMVGVVSIEDSTLQERMAGNSRDLLVALEAAETGLRAGERYLQNSVLGEFTTSGTNGLYAEETTVTSFEEADRNWVSLAAGTLDGVAEQPKYFIQEVNSPLITASANGLTNADATRSAESEVIYRVVSLGHGASPDAVVVLETTYRR